MPAQHIEVKQYAYAQYAAIDNSVTGIVNLFDGVGKHVANLYFVRDGTLPPPMADDIGLIFIHLHENAFPVIVAMLGSGAQVYVHWDGNVGSVGTSMQTVG